MQVPDVSEYELNFKDRPSSLMDDSRTVHLLRECRAKTAKQQPGMVMIYVYDI